MTTFFVHFVSGHGISFSTKGRASLSGWAEGLHCSLVPERFISVIKLTNKVKSKTIRVTARRGV
jgi:hypothetical protein